MTYGVRGLVLAATVTALAACSAPSPQPEPALPPRPVSVAADRIAPCAMLTSEQTMLLDLRKPSPGSGVVDGLPSPGCTWLGNDVGYNVQFIPIGTEVAIPVPGSTITRVNGFGAVRNSPTIPGAPPICQVSVDAAPAQSIRVQANANPNPPYGMDELCRRAEEAASMVMTTVVANAPK